jgi:hypothetical protein
VLCAAIRLSGDEKVLLCGGCDDEVHLACEDLQPVPKGDWLYCFCAAKISRVLRDNMQEQAAKATTLASS